MKIKSNNINNKVSFSFSFLSNCHTKKYVEAISHIILVRSNIDSFTHLESHVSKVWPTCLLYITK